MSSGCFLHVTLWQKLANGFGGGQMYLTVFQPPFPPAMDNATICAKLKSTTLEPAFEGHNPSQGQCGRQERI
jgi:hypothetical protein